MPVRPWKTYLPIPSSTKTPSAFSKASRVRHVSSSVRPNNRGCRHFGDLTLSHVQRLSLAGVTRRSYSGAVTTNTKVSELSQKGLGEEYEKLENGTVSDALEQAKEKQSRTPWHREGSDVPPVRRLRSAGAMTKGKLLTTPSRLLKLILPLTTTDHNSDRKDVEPLALLVHAQQPLSYLERLIQSELPLVKTSKGEDKIPTVHFLAEDMAQDAIMPKEPQAGEEGEMDETRIDGELTKTGKVSRSRRDKAEARGSMGEGGVEFYSGSGHEKAEHSSEDPKFVRWSSSTEIGDFIRDAARGKEFEVEIEGREEKIRVGVPSFGDRTYFLRSRLKKTSDKIADMASIKKECDVLAHKGAQRVAIGGFGVLVAWWYTVYRLTFETGLGWDFMEPVTYLVGLSTLIASYTWFLWHNREISYRSALNLTISRRQSKLYASRGFDLQKWEALIEEGNALRKEVKAVANEYDVEWDESSEIKDEKATEALKQERDKQKKGKSSKKDKGEDESDD